MAFLPIDEATKLANFWADRSDRNASIMRALGSHGSLTEVAEEFDISCERVRQLLKQTRNDMDYRQTLPSWLRTASTRLVRRLNELGATDPESAMEIKKERFLTYNIGKSTLSEMYRLLRAAGFDPDVKKKTRTLMSYSELVVIKELILAGAHDAAIKKLDNALLRLTDVDASPQRPPDH